MTFEIVPDERSGWLVILDGYPQSHVNLDDPSDLAFEYIALAATAVDATFSTPDRLRATHVGGAGLTLPRWIEATRPGSPQIVLEPHGALTAAVRSALPLPRGHRIRVREVDGARGMRQLADGSADLLVVDAYAGARMPVELAALPFLTDCARALAPEGLVLLNVADDSHGRYVDRVAAGVRAAGLESVALLATSDIAKGRRFGNRIVVGSATALDLSELERMVRRLPWPARAYRPRPAKPFTDESEPSPSPPPLDRSWRVR